MSSTSQHLALVSRLAKYAQPATLVAVLAASFPALVRQPSRALLATLPIVVLLQVAYALICLSVTGPGGGKPARKARPGEKKKPGQSEVRNIFTVWHFPLPRLRTKKKWLAGVT